MRLVIDLQGGQTPGSRHRGIGRYSMSLTEGIVRQARDHEVVIVTNSLFPEALADIRERFSGLIPAANFLSFDAISPSNQLDPSNRARQSCNERLREEFVASLSPDIVHVTSLFEGLDTDAVVSIGKYHGLPTAVSLYDLIPLINADPYLSNPVVRHWYADRLSNLRRADLLLAISGSSRQEAIDFLGFSPESVVDVGTAADPQFCPVAVSDTERADLLARYGLRDKFVMYTGGIDPRKNIERLIEAYAQLPGEVRAGHSLAVVCSCNAADRKRLTDLATASGLRGRDFALTGFVPELDLIRLYQLSDLFVFPSWHEGFGLPALEAMQCGARVLGSARSSLPEIIGIDEAMFDPFSVSDIARHLERGMTDREFRGRLERNSVVQRERFSWERSAATALAALEGEAQRAKRASIAPAVPRTLPRLAYFAPKPPQRSGIASYSAELVPELARHYAIEWIVADDYIDEDAVIGLSPDTHTTPVSEFVARRGEFDRVLYHVGNSDFHQYMLPVMGIAPGVCVQHDFFLSGLLSHTEQQQRSHVWTDALYRSHGYAALAERFATDGFMPALWKYPSSLAPFSESFGTIVHSKESCRLAELFYGEDVAAQVAVIPHLRVLPPPFDRATARQRVAIGNDQVLVCSFGIMGETKRSADLIEAWLQSGLGRGGAARLVFVGQAPGGDYGARIAELIASDPNRSIAITDWADDALYRDYLRAADVAVQLRRKSRGETSGTILDCMAHGVPTIINAHGAAKDIDGAGVLSIADEFSGAELIDALQRLGTSPAERERLGTQARAIITRDHSPRRCARQYRDIIERFYAARQATRLGVSVALAPDARQLDGGDLERLSQAVANTFAEDGADLVYLDVSALIDHWSEASAAQLKAAVSSSERRVEPICWSAEREGFVLAHRLTLQSIGAPADALPEGEPVAFQRNAAAVIIAARAGEAVPDRWKAIQLLFNVDCHTVTQIQDLSGVSSAG